MKSHRLVNFYPSPNEFGGSCTQVGEPGMVPADPKVSRAQRP